jgi:hypothetical protein
VSQFVCPRCQQPFFGEHGLASLVETSCAHCGLTLEQARAAAFGLPLEPAPPRTEPRRSPRPPQPPAIPAATPPLVAYASARGWHVVSPEAIEGEARGVRVAIERDEGRLFIDADGSALTVDDVQQLAAALATVPSARVEKIGSLARVEWSCREIDAAMLDVVVDALVAACSPRAGAYR